jgi:hypothetical protein
VTLGCNATSVSLPLSVTDAERLLESKDALLAKWKEEASVVRGNRLLASFRIPWCRQNMLVQGSNCMSGRARPRCPWHAACHALPQQVASKLERALLDHRRELDVREDAAVELRCAALELFSDIEVMCLCKRVNSVSFLDVDICWL